MFDKIKAWICPYNLKRYNLQLQCAKITFNDRMTNITHDQAGVL